MTSPCLPRYFDTFYNFAGIPPKTLGSIETTIDLQNIYNFVSSFWNTVSMPGLLLPSATWICGIPYKNDKVFSIGITFVQFVLLPYSSGRSSRYFSRLHDFSVNIPR